MRRGREARTWREVPAPPPWIFYLECSYEEGDEESIGGGGLGELGAGVSRV